MPGIADARSTTRRVAVLTPFFPPAYRGGGPIQTLVALLHAATDETDARVVCLNADLGDNSPLTKHPNRWQAAYGTTVWYATPRLLPILKAQRAVIKHHHPELVYINSFFDSEFSVLPQILRKLGQWHNATFMLAPRGELHSGALAIKSGKKRAFIRMYKFFRLHHGVIWHASTEIEANEIRREFGNNVRIVVKENETSLPITAHVRSPRQPGPCRFVFLSRLVENKGLHIVLAALQQLDEPVSLDVYGGYEDAAYEARCAALLDALPPHVTVTMHGAVDRERALHALQSADATLLPTVTENFGHVIAEALSQSSPVFCGKNTPWTETLASGGGTVIEPREVDQWAAAMRAFHTRGEAGWLEASRDAGQAYERWRNEDKGPHVFDLIREPLPAAR
ncbi:MAG: glycosyltransferase family 4 protein [Gulosibacter sp.]|uniref:glycosyltransferase family 4 protein n=1 Tax=Gulosibacter sp. TaxID=2817531 RepID=UPI003F904D2E